MQSEPTVLRIPSALHTESRPPYTTESFRAMQPYYTVCFYFCTEVSFGVCFCCTGLVGVGYGWVLIRIQRLFCCLAGKAGGAARPWLLRHIFSAKQPNRFRGTVQRRWNRERRTQELNRCTKTLNKQTG